LFAWKINNAPSLLSLNIQGIFFCEAQLQVFSYKVYFNNRYMADVEYDAAAGWIQTQGTLLPAATIEEIGAHIDGQLD
jgi:hypothetical protein